MTRLSLCVTVEFVDSGVRIFSWTLSIIVLLFQIFNYEKVSIISF